MTIEKTRVQLEMRERWDAFLVRKVLLVNGPLGYVGADLPPMAFPPLQQVAASMVYIEMVSIFAEAAENRLTELRISSEKKPLAERIAMLNVRGEIEDFAGIDAMRERRNTLAHEGESRVDKAELDKALAIVQRQFEKWSYTESLPPLQYFCRSSQRQDGPSRITEWSIGVQRDRQDAVKFSWTVREDPDTSA